MTDTSDPHRGEATHTVNDIARHFGVSPRTVFRWVEKTDIPFRRVGGTIRFRLTEVDDWALKNGRAPVTGKGAA